MELEKILKENKKKIRSLKYLWDSLTNPKNFLLPNTIDDFEKLNFFDPKITINSRECYFKEKENFFKLTNILCELSDIRDFLSYDSIRNISLSFIEKAVLKKNDNESDLEPDEYINFIIEALINSKKEFEFFRLIKGVEFIKITSLDLGEVQLFIFSEKHLNEIRKYSDEKNDNGFFVEKVEPFIRNNYIGKLCVKSIATGDKYKAKELSYRKINQVVNILRFIVCFLGHDRITEHLLKINLLAESYQTFEKAITLHKNDNLISLNLGITREPLFKLEIDKELLDNLRKNCFFNDLISILNKKDKTELEKVILTSIYWVGEAQDEFDPASAFIKFWIALESLYSQPNEPIVQTLAKGISITLAFGGYRLIDPKDVNNIYKNLKKLYDKRSKIVHVGNYQNVLPQELSEICKYSSWAVLTYLGLRSLGYKNLNQVIQETNRLYRIHIRTYFNYITSKTSKVFHTSKCKKTGLILPQYLTASNSRKEMVKSGKRPCIACNP